MECSRIQKTSFLNSTIGNILIPSSTFLIISYPFPYPLLLYSSSNVLYCFYPPTWIHQGHLHGVPVLATLLVEGPTGTNIIKELLYGPEVEENQQHHRYSFLFS